MDVDAERISSAIQNLYAEPLNRKSQSSLPQKMAAAFDATSCMMQVLEENSSPLMLGSTSNCMALISDYEKHFHALDVWSLRGARRLGQAVLGEDLVPEPELLASEWYNDLCRRCEIHHLVGAVFSLGPNTKGLIGIHRPYGAPSFEDHDRALMALLIPHLQQSYGFFQAAAIDERTRLLAFDVLEALALCVFVVSPDCRIEMMNGAAERVVAANGAIRVSNAQLSLRDTSLHDRMQSAVREASLAPLGRSLFSVETICVRTDGGAALPLKVVPLPLAIQNEPAEPLAAILLGEPSSSVGPSLDLLRTMYHLTAAEARLLCSILNGERLSDYAERSAVSKNTVHAQLKSVFGKTGCHRQADLVRKIMSDPMLRL